MPAKRKVKIVTRKLGRERAWGQHEGGSPSVIELDSRLTTRRRLTVLVHESLHEADPDMPEWKVTRMAPKIAEILWTDNWRRVEA